MSAYSPEMRARLEAMLAELRDDELLALVADTKHKTPQGRQLLAEELKKRVSPNQPKP